MTRLSRHQSNAIQLGGVANQSDRFPGCSQPQLYLGADGNPFHERTDRLDEIGVALVPPVVPHLFPDETARDADPDRCPFTHGL